MMLAWETAIHRKPRGFDPASARQRSVRQVPTRDLFIDEKVERRAARDQNRSSGMLTLIECVHHKRDGPVETRKCPRLSPGTYGAEGPKDMLRTNVP